MAELKEDIDKATEKCVREIMKIQIKKDREARKRFARDYAGFRNQTIERTMRHYGMFRCK